MFSTSQIFSNDKRIQTSEFYIYILVSQNKAL